MGLTKSFLLGTALYFGLLALLRVTLSDSLELDEAEQILFGQWLQWGYSSQPPLYTWLQKGLFALFGYQVLALALLKNGLMFILFALVFLSARRLLEDERRAVLAALSLLLIPAISWESARDLTHTVLAAVSVALSFLVALLLLERPTLFRYLGFGGTIGLGLLSKYNFVLHIAALLTALLSTAEGRRIVLDRRMVAALGLAAVFYAPHGWWLWNHADSLKAGLDKLSEQNRSGALYGTLRLGIAIAAYIAPLLLMWLILFRDALRNGSAKLRQGLESSVGCRVLSRYFPVLLILLLAMIWTSEIGKIKVRWLYPFFVLFPALAFTALPKDRLTRGRWRAYLGVTATTATAIVCMILFRVAGAGWLNRTTDLNLPFAEFAAQIRATGFSQGLIIGHNAHFAGNFHYQFRDCCPAFAPRSDLPFPADLEGDVLVVWETEKFSTPPKKLAAFVKNRLGVGLESTRVHYLTLPYRRTNDVPARMAFVIFHLGDLPWVAGLAP